MKNNINQSLIKKEIFHEIWGLTVSNMEPIEIGYFRFYNYPLHKGTIAQTYFPELRSTADIYDFHPGTWVSTIVEASDNNEAQNIAFDRFEELESILTFFTSFYNDVSAIGILNHIQPQRYKTIILSEGENQLQSDETILLANGKAEVRRNFVGAIGSTDFDFLQSNFSKANISICDLIVRLYKEQKNEMEKRLLTALTFYGKAFHDLRKPISFLESMMAIEALIQYQNKNQIIAPSVTAQITEYCTFLLAEKTYEDRMDFENKMKNFYKIRSKLSHGESEEVSLDDCKEILYTARNLITIFLVDEKIKNFTKIDELKQHIYELKYN